MSDIASLFDAFIAKGSDIVNKDDIWREKPVSLYEFFTEDKFLGEKPYPGKQTELLNAIDEILSKEDKPSISEFEEVTEAIVLFGKGSGKDFLVSGIVAYVCYRLCCMIDPQGYYGFGKDEPLDIVNVATNAYQANNVFFKKLKARLKNCKWFKPTFSDPSRSLTVMHNEYQVTKNQIRFYKNITAHSTHSESESSEGYNPLVVVFDEIGGYSEQNAKSIYDMFSSSMVTRFGDRGLLILISFPRGEKTFFYQHYLSSLNDKKVWTIKGTSWEVNPTIKRSDLQPHYDKDDADAKTRFECLPPAQSEALYQFPERIDECVRRSVTPLVSERIVTERKLPNGETRYYMGLKVYGMDQLDPNFVYYLGGDAALNDDSYCISLMKGMPTLVEAFEDGTIITKLVNKPVEEILLKWTPDKKNRFPVDLLNVADILEELSKRVTIASALFDKFNSGDIIQRLVNLGVDAQDKGFSNPFQVTIHVGMKNLVYTHFIEFLNVPEANEELKYLKIENNNKITHDTHGKDYSDARASAVYLCVNAPVETLNHFCMPAIVGARRK